MKKETGNIENLFKDTFDNFEADAPANTWANIQVGIKPAATAGKSLLKFLAAAAIIGGMIGGYFIFNTPPKNDLAIKNQPPIVTTKQVTPVIEPQSSSDNNSSATSPSSDNKDVSASAADYKKENENKTAPIVVENSEPTQIIPAQKEISKTDFSKKEPEKADNKVSENKKVEQEITNYIPALANINVDVTGGDVPLTVHFSNGGNGVSFEWDFGDGKEVSKFPTPTRKFDVPGEYMVKLTVRDAKNIASTDYITIKAKPNTLIQIPNTFTPNGDSKNDRFEVKGDGIKNIEGTIIDPKTGKTIYSWYMPNDSWDGKFVDGSDAPNGNYYYVIRYIGTDDKQVEKRGTVSLNR
jgi:gliding motility-associated-like protein